MTRELPELPHAFARPELLELALTHGSLGAQRDNERLEFLGDSVLDLVVAEALHELEPPLDEGPMTVLKADLVSRRALAVVARELKLDARARIGPGLAGQALPDSVLANLYEALVGAVHLDGGLPAARAFVRATLQAALERAGRERSAANPKQELQILLQQSARALPRYTLLETRGAAHERVFRVAAEVDGEAHPAAWGRTLREAETWAAHEALGVLRARAREAAAREDAS
jgi:ribonuclease-3